MVDFGTFFTVLFNTGDAVTGNNVCFEAAVNCGEALFGAILLLMEFRYSSWNEI